MANQLDSSAWAASKRALEEVAADARVLQTVDLGRKARVHALAIYVDAIPPLLKFSSPSDGALLNVVRPAFALSYSDVGSGVDPTTLVFQRGSQIPT